MPDAPDWGQREARMFGEQKAAEKPPDTDDLPLLEPRLFRTRDGRVWLERMSRALFDHALGPEPSEPLLRYFEAQRDLIRRIRRHIREAEAREAAPQK